MFKRIGLLLGVLLLLSVVSVYALRPSVDAVQTTQELAKQQIPAERLHELPQDVVDQLNGISIEDFIALNKGFVPNALRPFTDYPVNVVVEMSGEPLADVYARQQARQIDGTMAASAQMAYVQTLTAAQSPVADKIKALGGMVIDQYTKSYNGLLAQIPANQIAALEAMPGVKAVHNAPVHYPDLSVSVSLIGADVVSDVYGFDGTGVTIGIIDTGIDYYHAALGGSGDPADYANANPNIIEPGTFPTVKVAGGYDFAGADYDASDPALSVPTPDPNPLDVVGHGTHVSSIAAGVGSTEVGAGVAPGATLYALKVFGDIGGSTNLTASAIEWAMDPNGDGDITDHLDVINMSLGSPFGPGNVDDPSVVASNNAVKVGIVVVASAGNEGDTSYITGSPGSADGVISVAASTTGYVTGPTVNISGTSYVTQTNIVYQPSVIEGSSFTDAVTAPLSYAGNLTTTNTLCSIDGIPTNAMDGTIALIQRGDCSFYIKINNAAALGAKAALIYNNAGDELVTMSGNPVVIPGAFLRQTDGENLVAGVGETAVVAAEYDVVTVVNQYIPADYIGSFSSRGPRGTDSMLKPEITAPGVAIFAAQVGTGVDGISYSGTSMAAPHVAGVAALMREAHPTWGVEHVKAAMMNTAVDLQDGSPVPRQGAGRVDAVASVTSDAVAVGDEDLVSLNWGVLPINSDNYVDVKMVNLRNYTSTAKTYDTDWYFYTESYTTGVSLDMPTQVSVGANGLSALPVTLNIDATAVANDFGDALGEYSGYIVLTDTVTSDVLRLPFYLVPKPYTALTEVDSLTSIDAAGTGYIDLQQTGPISSSLWVYPAYVIEPDETTVGAAGDIRMIGMDYGGLSPYGDIIAPAISTWDAWHTPQPYFGEFDMYIDVNEDGVWDYVDFNFNYGWWTGGDDTNVWVVIQVDLNTGLLYLASPYTIWTGFNASFMEWYLPSDWNGLDQLTDSSPNTTFDFQFIGFDYEGNADVTDVKSFDFAKPPFVWAAADPGPSDPEGIVLWAVDSLGGYLSTQPDGLMLVDYYGKPDDQVYYWPVSVTGYPEIYLPIAFK